MNRCLQGSPVPEWMTKENTPLIKKDPPQESCPEQLQNHTLPTDDVENT